ncbi:MAG TPA: hypothetical protein VKU41_30920 [Polyangiaceae bacterium]|nr:hypothetical protein [Polyangiaceae bacterium]
MTSSASIDALLACALAVLDRAIVSVLAASVLSSACGVESPPTGPEETCVRACRTTAAQCSRDDCARGCELVLDRLVQHEGDHVLACVGQAQSAGSSEARERTGTLDESAGSSEARERTGTLDESAGSSEARDRATHPTGSGCDARRWARCAALVGPYADGGPPPPPPRRDGQDDLD